MQRAARPDAVVRALRAASRSSGRLDEADAIGERPEAAARPGDDAGAELVDVEALAAAGVEPGALALLLVAAEHGAPGGTARVPPGRRSSSARDRRCTRGGGCAVAAGVHAEELGEAAAPVRPARGRAGAGRRGSSGARGTRRSASRVADSVARPRRRSRPARAVVRRAGRAVAGSPRRRGLALEQVDPTRGHPSRGDAVGAVELEVGTAHGLTFASVHSKVCSIGTGESQNCRCRRSGGSRPTARPTR